MSNVVDSGRIMRQKDFAQYPEIDEIDIPEQYTVNPIDYRRDEVEKFHVLFWKRLLKNIYEEPSIIECDLYKDDNKNIAKVQTGYFRKIQGENNYWRDSLAMQINTGEIIPFPLSWIYLIRLPSGGVVELRSMEFNSIFRISQVILFKRSINHVSEETKKFIDCLLKEANRVGKNLFDPKKEFEKQKRVKTYQLANVYLSNYLSANVMLGLADSQEANLIEKYEKNDHDESNDDRWHLLLTKGMFYCSSIIYFFMALEGFVNLVFHSFLKKECSDKDFNLDQRLDIEQKIRFMPFICRGFRENCEISSEIFSEFKILKDYRNSLFHSKIEDSLKCLNFFEDGFLYNYEMAKNKESFLLTHKFKLTINDVIEYKNKVDTIVNCILQAMNQSTREKTEIYILNEPNISFAISEKGEAEIGRTKVV